MNKVFLIGNVGKEPDVRDFEDGKKVVSLTLATTERGYKLQNGTEIPDHTDWHNLKVSKGLADVFARFVHKGDKISVVGKVQYRTYEKNGIKQTFTEINVEDFEFISKGEASKNNTPAPTTTTHNAPAPKQETPKEEEALPF